MPEFSWRREWPFALLPAALSVAVRWPAVRDGRAFFHSDSAIGALMAEDIRAGTRFPLLHYGQAYLGGLEAYLAAPFLGLFPPGHPGGWALSQALIFALTLVLWYRLFHPVGGRAGALTASLLLAVGSKWSVMASAGHYIAYVSNLALGALLLVVALPFLRAPAPGRGFVVGLVAGLAWWNNPQVATVVGTLVLAFWWSKGEIPRRRAEGRLVLGPRWGLALAAALLALAATVALCFLRPPPAPEGARLRGIAAVRAHPEKLVPRALALCLALPLAMELWWAADRRRWLLVAGLFGAGFAAGVSPVALSKATGQTMGVAAPLTMDPAHAPAQVPGLRDNVRSMLADDPIPAGERRGPDWLYPALRWGTILATAAAAAGLAATCRREIACALALRRVDCSPGAIFLLLALVWTALGLLYPGDLAVRYAYPLLLPAGGIAAWGLGRLWELSRPAALLVFAVTLGHFAAVQDHFHRVWVPERLRGGGLEPPLFASLEQRQARRGYAHYWVSYRLRVLSARRLEVLPYEGTVRLPEEAAEIRRWRARLALPDPSRPGKTLSVGFEEIARYDGRAFWLFNPDPPNRLDGVAGDVAGHARFLDALGDRVVERWRVGPYLVYLQDDRPTTPR